MSKSIKRFIFHIDTFEKAMNVLDAIKIDGGTSEKIKYLLSVYPEIKNSTHAHIAEILGLERETISRKIKFCK